MNTKLFLLVWGVAAIVLTACQSTPSLPEMPSAAPAVEWALAQQVPVVDPVVEREQALAKALDIYAEGNYDDAIAELTPLIGASELPLASQVKVLKVIAFSQCALGRVRPCRQNFELALEQDPTFQLTEAEKGHPVWGREFNAARAAARNKRTPKKNP